MEPLTVDITTCAKLLGVSRGTAYSLVNQHKIPAIRLGRRWVVPLVALNAMLAEVGGRCAEPGERGIGQAGAKFVGAVESGVERRQPIENEGGEAGSRFRGDHQRLQLSRHARVVD